MKVYINLSIEKYSLKKKLFCSRTITEVKLNLFR